MKPRLQWIILEAYSEYDVCLSMDRITCKDYADIERQRWNTEKKYGCKIKFNIREEFTHGKE